MMSANDRQQITKRSCNRCGGRTVRVATISKSADNDAYEIYQCVDCNSHEWVLQDR